ncbi:MAG: ribonuclease E/G [Hyphomonas sp.]
MPVSRLLREQTIGETRWAALDAQGAPVSLYLERASDEGRAVIGERLSARVRKLDGGLGGAFVDLGAKGEGFLRLKPDAKLTEGASVEVQVSAEARRGKLARVRMAGAEAAQGGAAFWRASLDGGAAAEVDDRAAGDVEVQAAFDDALAATVTLRGGGRMQLERTEALIAADIDTAGRTARGSRAAGALAINCEAAAELARQIHLRGWGGLAVLDCIAPMDAAAGGKVRAAFLEAFRAISRRQVKALAPSAFGLMEISADWQTAPLSERMAGPEGAALEGLRRLEAAARGARMARLQLALPEAAHAWLAASGLDAEAKLAQTYGARLVIRPGQTQSPEVTPAP